MRRARVMSLIAQMERDKTLVHHVTYTEDLDYLVRAELFRPTTIDRVRDTWVLRDEQQDT